MYKIKLSPYHKIFYNEWKIEPNSYKYNIVFDQTCSSGLNVTRLKNGLHRFISDHLLFNSHINEIDNELYWVKNSYIKPLEYFEADHYSKQNLYEYVSKPFNLENEPLYRFGAFKNQNGECRLIFVVHHTIMDGASVDKFILSISNYYNDDLYNVELRLNAQLELINLTTVTLENNLFSNSIIYKNFWDNLLLDVEATDLRFLNIYDNDGTNNYKGSKTSNLIKEIKFTLDESDTGQLSSIMRKYGITPYMYSQCIFALLLYRYTNQNRFAISYPISIKEGGALTCGARINTSFVVYDFNKINSVEDLFVYIKTFFKSLKNGKTNYSYYPVYKILNNANKGILDIVFAQTNLKNTKFNFINTEILLVNDEFNIDLSNKIAFEQEMVNNQLNYRVKYNLSEIDDTILITFVKHYKKLFLNILTDLKDNLTHKLLIDYPILCNEEYNKIVYEWNQTEQEHPSNKTISQLFEEQVIKTPYNVAVIYENNRFTYQELNQRANQLANYIQQIYSINPNDLVVLYMNVNEYIIISMLAVLKCGAAYVPIDTDYPNHRVNYILDDIIPKVILTNKQHEFKLNNITKYLAIIAVDSYDNLNKISQKKQCNLNVQLSSNNLAYVIYTSGTTGNAKGVMVEHRNVVSLVKNITYVIPTESDKFLLLANIAFDAATFEIWCPLLNGAHLFIPFDKLVLISDANKFGNYLENNEITVLFLTKILFDNLYRLNPKIFYKLNYLLVGGEILDKDIVNKFSNSDYRSRNVMNIYGPTENTTFSTIYSIKYGHTYSVSIPIGKPITNKTCYILDKSLQVLPIGAIGELYVGGYGLARGYLNQPKLTKENFIANPFQTTGNKTNNVDSKLYKTGDLARYLPDGNIEYIGRNDSQIKIRGYRIEAKEIETILCKYDGIKQAVVLAMDNKRNLPVTLNNIDYSIVENKTYCLYSSITNQLESKILNEQGLLEGALEMLPIQKWFFEQKFKNINHWNQSFLIKAPALDTTILIDSLVELVNYHDNFKLRYKLYADKQVYVQYYVKEVFGKYCTGTSTINLQECEFKQLYLHELNISNIPYVEGTLEFDKQLYQILTDWQNSFDVENSPLFTFGYIYGYSDGSSRIYVALHHLIVDVVSWHIILYDLQKIYSELYMKHENGILNKSTTTLNLLGKKYTSYRQWVNIINSYAINNIHEKNYWLDMLSGYKAFDKQLTLLNKDNDNKSDKIKNNTTIKFELNEDYTSKLIKKSRLVINNKIDEMLAAVLAIALKELLVKNISSISNVSDAVYITLERHGREDINQFADTSHTLGWFTTMVPIKLVVGGNDIIETLKNTQQTFQSIPNKGVGYGALFGYTQNMPRISFNYLGQVDNNQHKSSWFITGEPSGRNIDYVNNNPNMIDIVSLIANNKLVFTIAGQLNKKQLNQFRDIFNLKLIDLVDTTIKMEKSCSTINYIPDVNVTCLNPNPNHLEFLKQYNNPVSNKSLVAYYVSDTKLDQSAIREYLSKQLPLYSIPQVFIRLNALPVTFSGKLDVRALPAPIADDDKEYYAPTNEKEYLICMAFAKVFDKKFISIYDDFFICGGDSILAITLVMHLQHYFSISVRDICTYRTPHKLAQHVDLSSDFIKSRLLEIMYIYEHPKKIEEPDQKIINDNLNCYMNSIKALQPDISVKNITNVLLTGATGYLGCNILNQLITTTNYNIYILIRADSDLAAMERINHKYKLYFGDSLKNMEIINSRVFVLRANLEQANLGLNQTLYTKLINIIDSVIHAAALVKQFGEDDIFYRANVQATVNLLEFSKLTKIKDFHYISTVSVLKHNNEFFKQWSNYYTEDHLPNNLELLDNNVYLRTKLEAERQIVQYRECGINTNIYRVGNLAFMIKNVSIQENIETVSFAHWLKYLFQSQQIFADCKVDISPVDLTANAIVKLFDKKCSVNNIYHVFNSYSFDLVKYMQSDDSLSVKILPVSEFIKHVIHDLENSINTETVLRFLLAHGWMGVEGFYQFLQNTYLQNKTQCILKFLDFKWTAIKNEQFNEYINTIFKLI